MNAIVLACACALLPAATTVPAHAQDTTPGVEPPVVIDSCREYSTNPPKFAPRIRVQVRFHARGTRTARDVRFEITAQAHATAHIADVGRFTPDAVVSHTFILPDNPVPASYRMPEPRCEVESARFEDGSTWTRPARQ